MNTTSTPSPFDYVRIQSELAVAVQDLLARGMLFAADWAGQLLSDVDRSRPASVRAVSIGPDSSALSDGVDAYRILIARTKFALKEYAQVVDVLKECSSTKALVMRCYARYLLGEQRAEELADEKSQSTGVAITITTNPYLRELFMELRDAWGDMDDDESEEVDQEESSLTVDEDDAIDWWEPTPSTLNLSPSTGSHSTISCIGKSLGGGHDAKSSVLPSARDAFVGYLYGVALDKMGMEKKARKVLIEACSLYPLNWSCWAALFRVRPTDDSVLQMLKAEKPKLCGHWLFPIFEAYVRAELQQHREALVIYDGLLQHLPQSLYVLRRVARVRYAMRDNDTAFKLYETIREKAPGSIEDMDIFSNVLYVKHMEAELAQLTLEATKAHKFSPEACCIVGNFYSLKAEREKAISYFRRALLMNRNYIEAWILIGHEYLELRAASSAIEAYRRAVDINPQDVRAWHSLGQAYEFLQLHLYSLFYYNRAAELSPSDSRMWVALGTCFENLRRKEEAVQCFRRAIDEGDEGVAVEGLRRNTV